MAAILITLLGAWLAIGGGTSVEAVEKIVSQRIAPTTQAQRYHEERIRKFEDAIEKLRAGQNSQAIVSAQILAEQKTLRELLQRIEARLSRSD